MKRSSIDDLELSDDDELWAKHDFRPSRVLKTESSVDVMQNRSSDDDKAKTYSSAAAPPPIESFAFSRNARAPDTVAMKQSSNCSNGNGNNSDFIQIIDTSSSEENVENLDDDDAELADTRTSKRNNSSRLSRGRRFVVDDDDEEIENEGEGSDIFEEQEEAEQVEEDDVVKKALLKCSQISAELKSELYGTTAGPPCSGYSEVEENSSVRIITQVSIFLCLDKFSMLSSSTADCALFCFLNDRFILYSEGKISKNLN